MLDARAIIAKIKEKKTPSAEELVWFSQGLADYSVTDAQAAAFAMAITLNGLDKEGLFALTAAMRDSGNTLRWETEKPVLDKHSTGGVGDCVSLILAPLLATAGAYVPMISGRGLGHTGGTLDKLEAIPGINVQLDTKSLTQVLDRVGCAIVSATSDIVPADKRLYAIRDASSTIDCLELIVSSILSKKLSSGLHGLVLDVKCGVGAFMKSYEDANVLSRALVETAHLAGCNTLALVTDMNEPLSSSIGNALEVNDAMNVLVHGKEGRLKELCLKIGSELLTENGLTETSFEAEAKLESLLEAGNAAETFGKMIFEMGGPIGFVDNWHKCLPKAPVTVEVRAPEESYITGWDCENLGLMCVKLGGGRQVETDKINPSVGLSNITPIGTKVQKDQPIARVHASQVEFAEKISLQVLNSVHFSEEPPPTRDLVLDKITC